MNANNVQSAIFRAKAKAKAFRNRAAGAIGTVSLLPALAFAQAAGPGEAITTEITSGKATVSSILVVLAGVLGLFLLWSMIKRAK
ncbi:hypothetical protein GUF72_21615 [Xanthomonas citri pv. citri]|uniref:hypothetical protein n=1 Tax=Xanthomonas citri TaxID=346 RepID=UPI00052CCC08|nr:hypothetical protein [Xanthomonas citri]APR11031.1 hypothetical protein BI314_13490 [Xanthomonas citri pv. citri]APR13723.1 hypothetical protein BI315_01435 [Xanthomonas citri pv. citri]APR20276.1 hypothetical protein BI316_12800 [Xanthomonas citri pv. citri]APR23707.1 hypothetical protein BJD09_05170 [Xanthomonas citri pv. citri]MBD1474531.1 hypothetical protein [Xanthomonas citri pv. citri]